MHWAHIYPESELYNYEYFSQDDVCRLCWNKNANTDIYLKISEYTAEMCLSDIIKDCLQIDVTNDHLNKICNDCLSEIKRFHYYKLFCQETNAKLKIVFEKHSLTSRESSHTSVKIKIEDIEENYDNEGIDTYLDDTLVFGETEAMKQRKPTSKCRVCSKKFGYKVSLEEHISSAHVRSESHPCEHCGATYTRLRGLRRHLVAKHGKQAKNKPVEQNLLVHVTQTDGDKIDILKEVEYELKDGDNVLLLKHQDGDVYMV
ncbi:hypothetical protein HF086_013749 [Spodoptera exigua]|uniref:Uncharacterized protein n=1 Tax=Spodoptera exigua TaxID=7107 RepID=A0A922SDP2_SPOEX|nr:hypothetical protein HF086_013749 [Spodoptera exigua]